MPVSLGIGPVNLADYLDRIQITLKNGTALQVDDFNRWGEPLGAGIQRVLTEDLGAILGSGQLRQFPWRRDEIPDWHLKIDILTLNRSDRVARLRAAWSLSNTHGDATTHRGMASLETPLQDDSYDALVMGYSELIHQLSQQVGRKIRAAQARLGKPG